VVMADEPPVGKRGEGEPRGGARPAGPSRRAPGSASPRPNPNPGIGRNDGPGHRDEACPGAGSGASHSSQGPSFADRYAHAPVSAQDDDLWGQEAVLDDLMACPPWQERNLADDDNGEPDDWETFPGTGGSGVPGDGSGRRERTGPSATSARIFSLGQRFAAGDALDAASPGPALAELADAAAGPGRDCADLDDDQLIGVLVAWQKTEAWAAAGRLSATAELIRRRPGDAELTHGRPGDQASPLPEDGSSSTASSAGAGSGAGAGAGPIPATFGKFAADELAVALACSRYAAERMLVLAHDLAVRLPLTAAALNDGLIDAYKAQLIAEATRVLDDARAAAAEALVIPHIRGLTPGQIRIRIARAVLKADPKAGRVRREQAQKDARVLLWREDAGTAALCGYSLPPDEALAADRIVHARALELKAAGLPGSMDQLRARAYLDVLLGKDSAALTRQEPGTSGTGSPSGSEPGSPGGSGEPGSPSGSEPGSPGGSGEPGNPSGSQPGSPGGTGPPGSAGDITGGNSARQPGALAARINLTVPLATLLGLADHPGEASGFGPVDAALARDMLNRAAAHPSTSWCLTVTDPDGLPLAHGCARPRHQRKPRPGTDRGSGPPGRRIEPPGGHRTWWLRSGLLGLRPDSLDLTFDLDPIAVTDCDHRHQTSAHDPSDRLRHLVEIRDGECTWPPCRRAARRCDFEHTIPWEQGGKTCACNGGPRCRHHHHQKQAPGWQLTQDRPGYSTWTTPSGRTYTSGPATYPV
jgi:hypothetical protein